MSEERKKMIRALHAELILTPKKDNMAGAVAELTRMRRKNLNLFIPDQFCNPDNNLAHYHGTAPEIWKDTDGRVDVLVSGVGSGGSLMGIGSFLKERNPDVKVVAVEPKNNSALLGHEPGLHKIEGIGDGFIPDILNPDIIDTVMEVSDEDAIETARQLASQNGLMVGISSGANIRGALMAAQLYGHEKRIVTLLPDAVDRYFSTDMFVYRRTSKKEKKLHDRSGEHTTINFRNSTGTWTGECTHT